MPKDYELTLVVDPQLSEEGGVDEMVKRYETMLGERGATVVNIDRWGARKLAYDVRKRQQGDYSFVQFQADPSAISEIDRTCRLDEAVLRHLIITVDGGFPVKEEVAEGATSPEASVEDNEDNEDDEDDILDGDDETEDEEDA